MMVTRKSRIRPIPLPSQYSEESIRSDGDSGWVYIDLDKRRVEQTVSGITTMAIWRSDLGKYFQIDWESKKYTEHRITRQHEDLLAVDIEDDSEWEYIATESFGLRKVDVYDVFRIGTNRRRARIYVDHETHVRWKEVTFNRLGEEVLVIEARNVEIGPPPASVFELPPGLREAPSR